VFELKWEKKLQKAENIGDIFEVVKEAVWHTTGQGRAGLSLVLVDIPKPLGGAHQIGSNAIIVNRSILMVRKFEKPQYYKPFIFYVLLHEYLHSLGYADERLVRQQCQNIIKQAFGEESRVYEVATEPEKFLAVDEHELGEIEVKYELVSDFDRSSTGNIYV